MTRNEKPRARGDGAFRANGPREGPFNDCSQNTRIPIYKQSANNRI